VRAPAAHGRRGPPAAPRRKTQESKLAMVQGGAAASTGSAPAGVLTRTERRRSAQANVPCAAGKPIRQARVAEEAAQLPQGGGPAACSMQIGGLGVLRTQVAQPANQGQEQKMRQEAIATGAWMALGSGGGGGRGAGNEGFCTGGGGASGTRGGCSGKALYGCLFCVLILCALDHSGVGRCCMCTFYVG
jgi:hypothetical protein